MLSFVNESLMLTLADMNSCQNCGKLNTPEAIFCRFCGTKFNFQKPVMSNPFDHSAPPRPYSWKTDEFQTQNEARKTTTIDQQRQQTAQFSPPQPNYQAAPLTYQQSHPISNTYMCPNCGSRYMPRFERQISTAGWVTFACLLVFFFPLFWIGLLIKEDIFVCQVCQTKTSAQLHR